VSHSTRIAWSEVDDAAQRIETWSRELLTAGWDDLQSRYLAYRAAHPDGRP
jgi:hypothetical protein